MRYHNNSSGKFPVSASPNQFMTASIFIITVFFLNGLLVSAGEKTIQEKVQNDHFIELKIPLTKGRYYSLHAFLKEANSKLKTTYYLKTIPDRQCEITDHEKNFLLIADHVGLIRFQLSKNQMIIGFPDPENERVRKKNKEWICRLLQLPCSSKCTLKVPTHLKPNVSTVLLIHGLEAKGDAMNELASAFRKQGIQVLNFEYPNDGPIADSGKQLSKALKKLSKKYPQLRLSIVAHSMGGLVARHSLECPGLNPESVTDLVTLGTPHRGSHMAKHRVWLELITETIPNLPIVDFRSIFADGLGEAGDDLHPDSQFLKKLNRRKRPVNVNYHTAAGNRGFVSKKEFQILANALSKEMKKRDTSKLEIARINGFLQLSAKELQTGTGDGVVAVTSAIKQDATNQKTFILNHMELISIKGTDKKDNEVFIWMMKVLNLPLKKAVEDE